jgi:hypothetical protein
MLKVKLAGAVIISLLAFSAARADVPLNIAVKALSQRLQNDLAVQTVQVHLNAVKKQPISRTELLVKGTGTANNLPIKFDVKVNTARNAAADVQYDFVDAANGTAEADSENAVAQSLLAKLNQDFKTDNIVVAVDGFETLNQNGTKIYKGTGDVRVGFDWSKISFDVIVGTAKNSTISVKYEIQK